jgi:lysozyme
MGWVQRGRRVRLAVMASLVTVAALAPRAHAQPSIVGPDVASYQHPGGASIDWGRVAGRAGFAFVKATEGTTYVNPWFGRDWAGARNARLVRGAYHYARPALPLSTAVDQARAFVRVVGSTREQGDLPAVLDLEETGGLGPAQLSAWARAWLTTAEALTGRLPVLYTYRYFWGAAMGGDPTFGAYPLWLAAYSGTAPAPLPGWSRWTFWQHTSAAHYPGISGGVDESVFCCADSTLAGLADGRTLAITRLWSRMGGASGALGLPTGPEAAAPGRGWWQAYEHGAIVWTPRTGVHTVVGAMWDRYRATGGVTGSLGLPATDEWRPRSGVLQQRFVRGQLLWSAATGAHALTGAFLGRWIHDGGLRSPAGLPTGEATPRTGGSSQQFAGAGYYLSGGAVRAVPDVLRERYEQLGGPDSPFGMPTTEVYPVVGGRAVRLQVGVLRELVVGGVSVVV